MTLVESTRSRSHRKPSAIDMFADLDWAKLIRLGVWVGFCVLLIVLA